MAGEVEVLSKLLPKNNAFVGLVDANQVIGSWSFGLHLVGTSLGYKGYKYFPFAATIVGWTFVSSTSGSAVVDLRKCALADVPATASITAAAPPTLSAQQYASDIVLDGWTTAIAAGEVVEFYVVSNSGIQNATLDIQYVRA